VRYPPSNTVLWFGVLGGAVAWAAQFVANLFFTFAQCNAPSGRWMLPIHDWEIGLSIAAVSVGVAATSVCVWLYRRTFHLDHVAEAERRGLGTAPPTGRLSFMAMVGLTVNFLALSIMIMTGIGAPLLHVCQQS
jgi:hypothetical protein